MQVLMRRPNFLFVIALAIVVSACSLVPDSAPAPPPVATVDTSALAAAVLSQVEEQLAAESPEQNAAAAESPDVNEAEIVESVVAQVEERLAQQEEEAPLVFANQATEIASQNLEDSLIALYQRANQGVVFIVVPLVGSGSGFVVSDDGFILTNNHVVDGGSSYEVVFAGGERRQAELIGQDVDSDLAVIQVEDLPAGAEPLPLGSSAELVVGQFVVAIGNPFGEQGSMSLGIVSGLGRSLQSQRELSVGSSYSLPEVVQTDAPINPGNSGGPLLNLDGEVVGVNSAIRSTTGTNSGVGFSIPVRAVKRILPSLIQGKSYDYPYVGAAFDSELSLEEQSDFNLPQSQGAYVVSVTEGSPADEAGLQAANASTGRGGDLIVTVDDHPINDFADLNSYLVFETSVGQTIEITVLRSGEMVDLTLTLGSRP